MTTENAKHDMNREGLGPLTYNWKGLWLVEWNEEQEAFHIESAHSRFHGSIVSFRQRHNCGPWVSLGIFNSYKEASAFAGLLRQLRGI